MVCKIIKVVDINWLALNDWSTDNSSEHYKLLLFWSSYVISENTIEFADKKSKQTENKKRNLVRSNDMNSSQKIDVD